MGGFVFVATNVKLPKKRAKLSTLRDTYMKPEQEPLKEDGKLAKAPYLAPCWFSRVHPSRSSYTAYMISSKIQTMGPQYDPQS